MPKIEAGNDQHWLLDGVPQQRGAWEVIVIGNNVELKAIGKVGLSSKTGSLIFSDFTDAGDAPYASTQALIDDLKTFFFRSVAGGGGGGVSSVSGDGVNNTDPANPILTFPTSNQVDNDSLIPGSSVTLALNELGVATSDNTTDIGTNTTNIGNNTTAIGNKIDLSEKAAANGVATLDGGGTIPQSQIPFTSNLIYLGTWDASTNTPTLADGVGNTGEFYICNVTGTADLGSGNISFDSGDWVLYNGSIWEKSDNTSEVSSVFGRTGNVVGQVGDYTTNLVSEDTNKNYVTDAEKTVLGNTSGTNTGDETASSIKTKYESNSNTNAFTDAEKTKVINLSGTNTGDETTGTIQTKRPLKTVNLQSLEGTGNVSISGATLTKETSFSSTQINNFNSNTLTDVPNMKITIATAGNYSFISTINCFNDQNEEVEVTLAITPAFSRNITLIDGTTQSLTSGSQFSFTKQLQFDTQRKKQDQTLQRDFIIDGLLVGDEIDVQINTRGDNIDIENRWLTGFTVS